MRFNRPLVRRLLLGASLLLNLGLLIGSRHMGAILDYARPADHWDWIFPLGLSFYTFQALTYTIDLYRADVHERSAEGTSSLLAHLASVSFFPTILAGPITRVSDLVKQFERDPMLDPAAGGRAFFLIGLGLIKKFLIADYLAENLVNRVFDTPDLYSGFEVLVAVFAYSLQLYYDFSGYTDIARGAGQLFGIKLPINFDRPYLSLDIAEFWRRWHISFSSWLRDYLFYALPGNRTRVMPYINLILTMLLGGLWHGLTWNFAIWGLLHGTALAFVRGWQTWRGRWKPPVPLHKQVPAIALTYLFVCFTWIFFRAATLDQAQSILRRIGSLTFSASNLSPATAGVLLIAVASCLATKKMYASAIERIQRAPGAGARHRAGAHRHRHRIAGWPGFGALRLLEVLITVAFPLNTAVGVAVVIGLLCAAHFVVPAAKTPTPELFTSLMDFTPESTPEAPLVRHVNQPEETPTPILKPGHSTLEDSNGALNAFLRQPFKARRARPEAQTSHSIVHHGDSSCTPPA